MPRLGVLGWPVAHSRSPAMHEAAFRATGLTGWTYQRLPVPPEVVEEAIRALPAAGFRGANVTIPHKEAALAVATDATPRARAIGAANTLTFAEGAIHADNTDAPGLLAVLPRDVRGLDAVVLGAGGSARAAIWALLDAGARRVALWNRTPERAARLAAELGAEAVREAPAADLLVNCTSVGLDGDGDPFKQLPVAADGLGDYDIVADLVYVPSRPQGTPLIEAARSAGCATVDGLEVLVGQGALSFEAWTGLDAPRDAMRDAARGPLHDPSPHPPEPGPGGDGA